MRHALLAVCLFLFAVGASAQVPTAYYGFLEVVDFSGKPVEGAKVVQIRPNGAKDRSPRVTEKAGKLKKGIFVSYRHNQGPAFTITKEAFYPFSDYFGVFTYRTVRRYRSSELAARVSLIPKPGSPGSNEKTEAEQLKRDGFAAAWKGDSKKIRELLKRGLSSQLRTMDLAGLPIVEDRSLLTVALMSRDLETSKLLFEAGASLDSKSSKRLLFGLVSGGPSKRGLKGSPGETQYKDLEKFLIYLFSRFPVDELSESDKVYLLRSASYGGYVDLGREIAAMGLDLEQKIAWRLIPDVIRGAKRNRFETVEFLIDIGFDINRSPSTPPRRYCRLPFWEAAIQQDLEMIDFLVEKGADVNATCNNRGTILDVVRKHRRLGMNEELIERLVSHGVVETKSTY